MLIPYNDIGKNPHENFNETAGLRHVMYNSPLALRGNRRKQPVPTKPEEAWTPKLVTGTTSNGNAWIQMAMKYFQRQYQKMSLAERRG